MKTQWIKVTGEDGVFFDLVMRRNRESHLNFLRAGGYEAVAVAASDVLPCIYRDFTMGEDTYTEHVWRNGTDFYTEEN